LELRSWIFVSLSALTLACDPSQSPEGSDPSQETGSNEHTEDHAGNAVASSTANSPSGQLGAEAGNANASTGGERVGTEAGAPRADQRDAGVGADSAASGSDAAAQRPDWDGLVTLGTSVTKGPDGAVVGGDGGIPHFDPATAGPVLNAQAQMACLALTTTLCNRSADCQVSLAQLSASRREQLFASCQDALLRNHNCNRAISTSNALSACIETVQTRACSSVFANDFATACFDQITFQPSP
jgi:hypothetical protein